MAAGDRLRTPAMVAKRLGVSRKTAREWMKSGAIPGVTRRGCGRGTRYYVTEANLARFVADIHAGNVALDHLSGL